MDIKTIGTGLAKINPNQSQKVNTEGSNTSFANVFKSYMENVNATLNKSSELTGQVAAGKVDNVHDVMIASQQSKIALELTVTIRDKAVEAYQETMRMQF
ncbi:flagellar hook-basal body complex protein FliE [Bacillus sp. DNRA2]|uniref:flagellar hook-basal body complex protein FliE n=1 Tax=Bacillus sp. DNRA2 TaxID=2723053 RepID=UPI00145C5B06|nr:flagellar hook-basal body complex protein FliE [Bacillus sp. DNRA2]NMD69091.1 flagellar hook-basal body complex protein FliE [Bacillus sp. DNRA2]